MALELPILPLPDAVLLPGAVTRVEISAPDRIALVEHLLQARKGEIMEIGVVPWVSPDSASDVLAQLEQIIEESGEPKALPNDPSAGGAGGRIVPGTAALPGTSIGQDAGAAAGEGGLFHVGTITRVLQVSRSRAAASRASPPSYILLLDGRCRMRVDRMLGDDPYLLASCTSLEGASGGRGKDGAAADPWLTTPEGTEVVERLRRGARELLGLDEGGPFGGGGGSRGRGGRRGSHSSGGGLGPGNSGIGALNGRLSAALDAASPARLADMLSGGLESSLAERLAVLEAVGAAERVRRAAGVLQRRVQQEDVESRIAQRVEKQMTKAQREHILRQQLRAIQDELGEGGLGPGEGPEEELAELERRLRIAQPPPAVLRAAQRELRRLQRGGDAQPGHAASRAYLECLADLPWNRTCEDVLRDRAAAAAGGPAAPKAALPDDPAHADDPAPAMREAREAEVRAPLDLAEAAAALDAHHFGLDKAKRRIVEYLAVRRLRGPDARAPVLCFIGPPGVGKTTLARSVAEALGRPMYRVSLGGVRDEADIRGHRRTYIGAMPGRIIHGLRRVGVKDPVLLLDELDKTGKDSRGDPAAALLEVLDPEQNHAFTDHYVGAPFDLSKVVFFATANRASDIPEALYDRLEVINIQGYTLEEKVRIACDHLVPKVLEEHGLGAGQLQIPEEVVESIAVGYTMEAGVRSLERCLAALARHVAVQVAGAGESGGDGGAPLQLPPPPSSPPASAPPAGMAGAVLAAAGPGRAGAGGPAGWGGAVAGGGAATAALVATEGLPPTLPIVVDLALVTRVLGPPKFDPHSEPADRISRPGVAAGLVWTAYGGQVQYVECCQVPGRGSVPAGGGGGVGEMSLTLTGQLGDVLQESAQIAVSWVRAHADLLGLGPAPGPGGRESGASAGAGGGAAAAGGGAPKSEVHIHFPAGAVPKDGPSAGVTLAVALVSLLSGRRVRSDTAMTGELTLSGQVLPVGGVKEKLLAAHRLGIRQVIIPRKNLADAEHELPAEVRANLDLRPCATVEEVLDHALEGGITLSHTAKL